MSQLFKRLPIVILVSVLALCLALTLVMVGFTVSKKDSLNTPVFSDEEEGQTLSFPDDLLSENDSVVEIDAIEEKSGEEISSIADSSSRDESYKVETDEDYSSSKKDSYEESIYKDEGIRVQTVGEIKEREPIKSVHARNAAIVAPPSSVSKSTSEKERYNSQYDTQREDQIETPTTKECPQKAFIEYFIVDYNKRFYTTVANPILLTLVCKAPPKAAFTMVRVYARRLASDNTILSRDLIFYLPKIYVVSSRSQTQFYWAGKDNKGKFLKKGRYILYAEFELFDSEGNVIAQTGRYPEPKWDYIVTFK